MVAATPAEPTETRPDSTVVRTGANRASHDLCRIFAMSTGRQPLPATFYPLELWDAVRANAGCTNRARPS
jgi:hypothetical protein